ncbi:membrane dipeptidase [Luteibacter sp.]|jgi:microsomal dipeptidase-like Zn-dependent dipeptidase|uniref:membrane dipeptidase n=1 Tax=Luteibacter sp. TaxID=1886636 RepID=UPI002F42E3E8
MKKVLVFALFCASAQAQDHPLTLDTHVDIPLSYMHDAKFDAGKDGPLKVDLPKMRRGGLDAAFFVIYVEQGPLTPAGYAKAVAQAARKYDDIDLMLKRYPDQIRLARTPDEVRANRTAGRLSAMIGIENSYSLGHDLKRLDAAYARGARYVGLAHVGNNDLCGSSLPSKELGDKPDSNLGLSDFGRQVVQRANALGMMVDVSHASDACVRDVLALSTAPIIASHSSARAVTDHPRNLPDDLLKAIAGKGGVIQAVAYKEFLKKDPAREVAEKALQKRVVREAGDREYDSEKHDYLPSYVEGMKAIEREHPLATLGDFLDHIQHMVKVAGIDHVGIASDFDGGGEITGWMDASETRNVTAGLKSRGFSDADIAKIWSGNLLRVWAADEAASSASLDTLVDEAVARYDIPGIAVGVIEDGKVVYTRTAGVLAETKGRKVDTRTLFKIASNSKAMTTALLARLVAAGKLRWDDPVVKYLPDFRMNDPWVTREMQVRDLLIHNSGLREGAGDLMLWPEPNRFTRKDILAGLAYLKQEHSFRSRYAYDNLLYVVAGEVAAAAGGAPYETLLRREVFEPLGLSRCQIGSWSRDGVGNVAQPHRHGNHGNEVVNADPPTIPAITSAAAGGVRCDLDDMLRWAGNWLTPDASQLGWLDAKQREPLWSIQNPMPVGERRRTWNDTHLYGYGYGWRLADVDGQWSVSHTGTLSGMYSTLSLLPEKHSGFVIMMNGGGEDARDALAEAILKRFTVSGEKHTVGEYAGLMTAEASAPGASRAPDTSSRVAASADEAKAMLGVWRDPWFGEVSICPAKGGVGFAAAKSPVMTGTLERLGARYLVQWKGEGMDAEPWLDLATPGHLLLTKVDPDADFSNDYEDLDFTRVGACP